MPKPNYLFIFDLAIYKVVKSVGNTDSCQVRYVLNPPFGAVTVEVGYLNHSEISLTSTHWNRLVRLLRDELDESGIEVVMELVPNLWSSYKAKLVDAIKSGLIKEIPESPA